MSEFTNTVDTNGDLETLTALVAQTQTSLADDKLTALNQYAFYYNYGIESVDFPSLTSIGGYAFEYCKNLSSVSIPSIKTIGGYAFQDCWKINQLDIQTATSIPSSGFVNCPAGVLELPNATSGNTYSNQYYGPSGFDLSKKLSIAANWFNNGYNMCHLILRSPEVCSLANTSAFTGTPIAAGYGYIYVPSSLVDTYKAETNWLTYASQIVSLSEYPKQTEYGTITDSWSTIFANEANGTYSSLYSIGDTKTLMVNGAYVMMRLVAMDEDDLADDTGKAKMTWISDGFIHKPWMNPTNTTTGGWKDCWLRSYLRNTVLPVIDSTVRSNIKEVHKTYYDYDTSSTLTVDDTVWIPSFREVQSATTTYRESSGAEYTGYFGTATTDSAKIKKEGPCGTGSAYVWWLRSACSSTNFRNVNTSGGANNNYSASSTSGLVLGFCT